MSWLIELPAETVAAVISLVIAVFGVLLRLLASYVPWLASFIERYREEWGTAIGILLVNIMQTYLPGGEWAGTSVLLVQLAVAVATVLLAKAALAKAGAALQ